MDISNINLAKRAEKFLKKQNKDMQIRIFKAILKIPKGEIQISSVTGYPHLLKIRIGDIRVIFDKDFTQIIDVVDMGNRGEIYNRY